MLGKQQNMIESKFLLIFTLYGHISVRHAIATCSRYGHMCLLHDAFLPEALLNVTVHVTNLHNKNSNNNNNTSNNNY